MKTRFLFPCLALLVFAPALFIASNPEFRQASELFITRGTYHPFWSLTLPRFLLAIMAGMMLAVSGLLLQTTLKNPLADSGILGVNAGASLGAVCAILLPAWFNWNITTESALLLFSMAGGLLSAIPVLIVSRIGNSSLTLLTGVAITAILGALSSALIFTIGQGKTDIALQWMAGGMYGRGWEQVSYLLPWFLACLAFIILVYLPLKWVRYDDAILRGIGINGALLRLGILLGTVFITAPAVSAVGPIGFVGLVIPHITHLLSANDPLRTMFTTLIFGAGFLALSDALAKHLLFPTEIPAGVITALLGVPFFLFLLRKHS
ncbi:FecCD family ABC transporter permease [Vibrio alginolyticus]|uniref:FecCD family ABC transporter permease n=1 Tax=Vibrio alginolyticus TaxID=663 RepID=UPI001BD5F89D|nr:iron ABC transporter permease [Vibrio alginolyticus]MBT0078601.1 iron ABC transporter permease [Vibrio alginolyticus]MBT0101849.1 iron ABC transporter permease [Vibrio alginolyticus]